MAFSRKRLYQTARFGMLAATAVLFGVALPGEIARAPQSHWAVLGALLVLYAVLLEMGVPFLAFRNFGQREGDPGRINFDLPLYALTFTALGWLDTALLSFAANLLTRGTSGRYNPAERLLTAGTRVPFFFLAGLLRPYFVPAALQLTPAGALAFFAFNALWIAAFILLWFDGITSLRTGTPMRKLLRTHLSDATLWSLFAAQVGWGYVSMQIFLRDGPALGIATLLPLVLFAAILRALHNQRLAVHRLTLARDAVQAMLGARDPMPHINSILSSVHSELLKETLQILAHTATPGEPWQTVATMGPTPDDAAIQVRRHAIRGLIDSDRNSSGATSQAHHVVAFAARDAVGRLLGVLAVHRPADAEHPIQRKPFEAAAAALAPLLRDFRTIAATQNAAAIDPLTGLANRRTILDALRRQIEHVGVGTNCSIIMLDIDLFKSVNDRLGHQAGDRCLQMVGFLIASNIRGCDRAGRIGGEEFVVMMPDATREVALVIGERLREAIEKSGFSHADGNPVTASVGVASATLTDTLQTLMDRADRALYAAKREGRNRVIEMPA